MVRAKGQKLAFCNTSIKPATQDKVKSSGANLIVKHSLISKWISKFFFFSSQVQPIAVSLGIKLKMPVFANCV